MAAVRRHNIYKDIIPEKTADIIQWIKDGESMKSVAMNLGISYDLLREWKSKKPEFADIISKGKIAHENNLRRGFFKKALGQCVTKKTERTFVKDKDGNILTETVKQIVTEMPPSDNLLIFAMCNVCGWVKATPKDEAEVANVVASSTPGMSIEDAFAALKRIKAVK